MKRATRSDRFAPAHTAFFLLACGQALVAIPMWAAEFLGWAPACADCAPSLRHAHEMLLGFAVAVIGGFLFTRLRWPALIAVAATWAAGRAAVFADAGMVSAVMALAYPATLAVLAGWPFVRAARTARNLAFAPVLFGFFIAEAAYQAGRLGLIAAGEADGVWFAFDMTATMLLVMGGRLIPAAMAGVVRSSGDTMADRNGPRLEMAILGAMAVSAAAHLSGHPSAAGAGWLVAGTAGTLRLVRWRFRAALAVPSLWPLQVGYGCLTAGLAASALAAWSDWWTPTAVMHVISIGGLGVITATMMVRTAMLRARVSRSYPRAALVAVFLLLAATAARVASPLAPPLLIAAAMLGWSVAFGLIGATLLALARHRD